MLKTKNKLHGKSGIKAFFFLFLFFVSLLFFSQAKDLIVSVRSGLDGLVPPALAVCYGYCPTVPTSLNQYRADGTTLINNASWLNASEVNLYSTTTVADSNPITLYYQLATTSGLFISSNDAPANACSSGTAYGSCSSRVWQTPASTKKVDLLTIPDSAAGYKWQVLGCTVSGCSNSWAVFNVTTPNFKVDATAPTTPGTLTLSKKNDTSITLKFNATSSDVNFRQYKIYYKAGASGVTEANTAFGSSTTPGDATFTDSNFSRHTTTTVTGLSAGTTYVFNIWAYDQAGNKASAAEFSTTVKSFSAAASSLSQYQSDGTTAIANGATANQNEVYLSATSTDADSDAITLYYQLATTSGTYITSTSTPASACSSGTAYASCPSRVWQTPSATKKADIKSIPDLAAGYKWQVLACDADGCARHWTAFNGTTPNFIVDTTGPTVTKLGNNSADVALSVGDTSLVFSEQLSAASKTAVQNALTAGADHSLSYSWSGGTLTITAAAITTFADDVIAASVSDLAGNSTASLLLVDSVLASNQTTPDGSGNATINNMTPQTVIVNPTQAVAITSSGASSPTINVDPLITGGTGTLPAITITSADAYSSSVAIPATTVITDANTSWDGVISAPTVTSVTLPTVYGQTNTLSIAIEIGLSGEKLSFSRGVRVLLPGQVGKRAGYSRTGLAFTEITSVCAANDQTTGDALSADGDCKIDDGSDLVIWTKHFTRFAAYTQAVLPVGSSYVPSVPVVNSEPVLSGAKIIFNAFNAVQLAVADNAAFANSSWQKYSSEYYYDKNFSGVYYIKFRSQDGGESKVYQVAVSQGAAGNSGGAAAGGAAPAGAVQSKTTAFQFRRDLRLGLSGADVKELQKFLNSHGFAVASSGSGSAGKETGFFGTLTKKALIKFQKAKGIKPPAGYFGSLTRKAVSGK